MNDFNKFFKTLYSSPAMIWKGGSGILFISLAIAILAMPSLTTGFDNSGRYMFGGMLFIYGIFRLYGCYADYKYLSDD